MVCILHTIRNYYQKDRSLGDGNDFLLGNMPLQLGNSGDQVVLKMSDLTLVDSVYYDDASPWPTAPDGDGPSLELVDPMNYASHTQGNGWAASVDTGTPGDINSTYNPSGVQNKKKYLYGNRGIIYCIGTNLIINSAQDGKKFIKLYNISGRTVLEKTFYSHNKNFNLSRLHNGIYFVYLKSTYKNVMDKITIIK